MQFFNQILVLDKTDKGYAISDKIYDVIYELNVIAPSLLLMVLPQLECKLKSAHEAERLSKFYYFLCFYLFMMIIHIR